MISLYKMARWGDLTLSKSAGKPPGLSYEFLWNIYELGLKKGMAQNAAEAAEQAAKGFPWRGFFTGALAAGIPAGIGLWAVQNEARKRGQRAALLAGGAGFAAGLAAPTLLTRAKQRLASALNSMVPQSTSYSVGANYVSPGSYQYYY